jgi:hypothetical protein
MLSVPCDEMQLKAVKDKNCSEIFHFYFPVKVPKNSDLSTAKIDSAIHVLQNMTFDKCSIIVDHHSQQCTEVAYRFSELGIDAEAFDAESGENHPFSACRRNLIVNLVDFEPAPATVDSYIRLIGKFVVAGALNFVLNLPDGKRLGLLKDAFGEGPVFVHKLPSEPALWRDLRKLKAAGEAATVQAIKEISQKIAAGRKVAVAGKSTLDSPIPIVQIESAAEVEQQAVEQVEHERENEAIGEKAKEMTEKVNKQAEEVNKNVEEVGQQVESCALKQKAESCALKEEAESCALKEKAESCAQKVEACIAKTANSCCSSDLCCSSQTNTCSIGVISSQESLSTAQNVKPSTESRFLPTKIKNSLFKTASSLFSMVSPSSSKANSPQA